VKRFALFVDGSNLFGALKALNVEVQDYEKLYGYIFEQARGVWRQAAHTGEDAAAEPSFCEWGGLYKSGAYAVKVLCLTLGDLRGVHYELRLREEQSSLTTVQKSAEGIVEAKASKARTVERSTELVTNVGTASVKQRKLPSVRRRTKPRLGSEGDAPVGLLMRIISRRTQSAEPPCT
jgi:hypothetical protein